ncbi:hypothetical protein BH09CHL1_BH09CHL1_30460 [soil metagenome]
MSNMTKPTKDLGYPTDPYGRIPAFHNIEGEAEFWDTHDISEFDGVELVPVRVTVNPEIGNSVHVRLDRDARDKLDQLARASGTDVSALAEKWLRDRLSEETKKSA